MKNTISVILFAILFSACANMVEEKVNYIGVTTPDFNSPQIDSLVLLYEADREAFYKAQKSNSMAAYYKSKVSNKDSYNVSSFYEDVVKILNVEKDTAETRKFQVYIKQSSDRAQEFVAGIKK